MRMILKTDLLDPQMGAKQVQTLLFRVDLGVMIMKELGLVWFGLFWFFIAHQSV